MPDYELIYRERVAEYDELVAHEDYLHNIPHALQQIRPLHGLDVVEMGAGTGRLTRLIAPHARSIIAFDASKAMLDVAAGTLPHLPPHNWLLAVADNCCLPARDGIADICVSGWSFGHATGWYPDNWRQGIRLAVGQMIRVLRPGGTAIILETLGTGREAPEPPTDALAEYYRLLEEECDFRSSWIRTDYRFESVEEAERLARFFFGDALAERVARERLTVLPECTGVWHRSA
ncbi:MAG TPA: class I SAM-dependent methyltransferase [Anaerolineae bacterium]|nr:class I SAM-dependent methyltransferase [Anaerolineae bacterium]